MPNRVTNVLRVSGSPVNVQAFVAGLEGEPYDDGSLRHVDFNRIIPRPEFLDHTASGFRDFDGVQHDSWYSNAETGEERPYTDEERALLDEMGVTGWYDWCIENWGTKWNAYSQTFRQLENTSERAVVEIEFQTAWACPEELLAEYIARHPNLSVVLTFADEDIGYNCGTKKFINGQMVVVAIPEGGSKEAMELAFSLHGYTEAEPGRWENESESTSTWSCFYEFNKEGNRYDFVEQNNETGEREVY